MLLFPSRSSKTTISVRGQIDRPQPTSQAKPVSVLECVCADDDNDDDFWQPDADDLTTRDAYKNKTDLDKPFYCPRTGR